MEGRRFFGERAMDSSQKEDFLVSRRRRWIKGIPVFSNLPHHRDNKFEGRPGIFREGGKIVNQDGEEDGGRDDMGRKTFGVMIVFGKRNSSENEMVVIVRKRGDVDKGILGMSEGGGEGNVVKG